MRFIVWTMLNCKETAAELRLSPKTAISRQFFLPILTELDNLGFFSKNHKLFWVLSSVILKSIFGVTNNKNCPFSAIYYKIILLALIIPKEYLGTLIMKTAAPKYRLVPKLTAPPPPILKLKNVSIKHLSKFRKKFGIFVEISKCVYSLYM